MKAGEQTDFDKREQEWWPPQKDLVFLYKLNPLRFDYFGRHIGDWKGVRVLDVGSGGGYTCEHLARLNAVVSGTDISSRSLEVARRHASQTGLEIDYSRCDEKRLPYPDATFDVVTCFDVLEHIEDKKATLIEIRRVLKPGGLLFFDTLNQSFIARLTVIWLGEVVFRSIEGGTHYWNLLIRPEDLLLLLEKAGFKDIRFAGVKFRMPSSFTNDLPLRIDPGGNRSIVYFGTAVNVS